MSYVYFELSDYEAALQQLSKITPEFYDYAEALLSRSWCYVTLKNFEKALEPLNELCDNYPDFYNIEEAYFLRAQCYMKLGYYNFAISEYNHVINPRADSAATALAHDDSVGISAYETQIDSLRKNLAVLEKNLVKTIPLRGVGRAAQLIDDPQLLEKTRSETVQTIVREREEFNRITAAIERLKKRADKRETRKKWEAYAEFGRVRAMYLRETVSQ